MYNNGFNFYQPINMRQPMMPQQMQQQVMPQQVMQEETLYVPNEQAAEAYLMAPNSFVRLWDANQPVFYERRTDAQGRPFPMEKYTYTKATNAPVEEPKDLKAQFVTREEFNALMAKLEPKKGEKKND